MGLLLGTACLIAAFVPDMVNSVKRDIQEYQKPKVDPRCEEIFERVRLTRHDENGNGIYGGDRSLDQCLYDAAGKECVRKRIPIDDSTVNWYCHGKAFRWLEH